MLPPVLNEQELLSYKRDMLQELDLLERSLTRTAHLRNVVDRNWIKLVRATIARMGPDLRYTDQAYHLFRILRDEESRSRLFERLDRAIRRVEKLASETNRLKNFRETLLKLKNPQANQIQAAIFELLVLETLIGHAEIGGLEIEIYPRLSNGRNLEARVRIDGRWCNFEAKAFGYSNHDVGMRVGGSRVGVHNVDSMVIQILDALDEKADQLSGTSDGESNVVLLALGLNADSHSGPWGIQEFFEGPKGHQLSAVLLIGSYLCRKPPRLFVNTNSARSLTGTEQTFLETLAAA